MMSVFDAHRLVNPDARALRARCDPGGAETVILIENQMPSHSHSVGDLEWGHTVDGNADRFRLIANDGQPFNGITGRLTAAPTGGDEAHENRPPYLALYFCKKD